MLITTMATLSLTKIVAKINYIGDTNMKINNDIMKIDNAGSDFQFSAIEVDRLGASEYTLVTLVLDMSSSVRDYQSELNESVATILDSCRMSPFAEKLMVRLVTFNENVYEEHGFMPLSELDNADYKNVVQPRGMTALFDASLNAIQATVDYGKTLYDNDFDSNAILFVVTDGADNSSSKSIQDVGDTIKSFNRNETVESFRSVLIGVNTEYSDVNTYLKDFKDTAGIDQYIDIKNANSNSLAKMADFISQSISAQSKSLGSGVASKALNF
jgi:uncharacterized protein YegL